MTDSTISVCCITHDCPNDQQQQLKRFLQDHHIGISEHADYHLHLHATGLEMHTADDPQTLVRVDFDNHKTQRRSQQSELLHRAIGITDKIKPRVLDATAGMGRDAYLIANRGCRVTMTEQHPLVYLLLQSGLQQATKTSVSSTMAKLDLIHADANSFLEQTETQFDVIYLDPMFPDKNKTAKTKKEMQLLRSLLDDDQESLELLDKAIDLAKHRVVIKRPLKAPPYAGKPPSYNLKGRTVRFDIFGIKAFN